MTPVRYRDRLSGELVSETHAIESQLRWLYHTRLGRCVLENLVSRRVVSWAYGIRMSLPSSRRLIPRFVAEYRLDPQEWAHPLDHYPHFDAFFARALKPGARPFAQDSSILASPCDGKVLVFPTLQADTELPVKGVHLSANRLLGSDAAAAPFVGGSALVIRLAPHDYHRFHFPDAGEAEPAQAIAGRYHSVSPIALETVPEALLLNKRAVTRFQSDHFGHIAYVEVGALTIGRIVQTYSPGRVAKGQEKGYFRFGGSTVVLLFEPATVVFDDDLLRDSASGLEVQVRAGMGIGRRHDAGIH